MHSLLFVFICYALCVCVFNIGARIWLGHGVLQTQTADIEVKWPWIIAFLLKLLALR